MRRLWILGALTGLSGIVAIALALSGLVVTDFWRDLVAWLSLFVTTLGLGYTVYQVTLIESVSRATQAAAEQARQESQRQIVQFTAASLHRLVNEASSCLERKEWGKAVLRLYDLADLAAQIGGESADWVDLVRGLREAAAQAAALESGRRKRAQHESWSQLLRELRTRLDAHFRPL